MIRFAAILALFTLLSCDTSNNHPRNKEIEKVVEKMNLSLATHQLDDLLACYSNKMDWENSFGWTIKNKNTLSSYFKDWLFPKYPKLESNRLKLVSKSTIINNRTAWVDVQQQILSEDLQDVVRSYRQTHLVVKNENVWLIQKSRLWLPSPHGNPPVEFLSSPSYFEP